VDPRHG